MANERLRQAIQRAGLGLEEVAEQVGIDVKTAERWITKGRLPHARNRAQTARLLSVDELELWPQAGDGRNGRSVSDGEVVRLYAHRGAVRRRLWLISTRMNSAQNAPSGIEVFAIAECPRVPPSTSSAQWIQRSTSTVPTRPTT